MPALDVSRLNRKSTRELAELAYSTDMLEASIGIAAINSMLDIDEARTVEMNASEVLASQGHGKNVALVGRFPFVQQLRQSTTQLWVIEQSPAKDEYPAESAIDLVPQADVVAITGSTLVNHTLDKLLTLCNPHALVIVWGPSTPLSPVLFDHGVHILCGTRVIDELSVLHRVGLDASIQKMDGVKRLTFIREKTEK
jgi:uncharacterized protein (DUF4213/DUF364 family)